MNEVVVRSNPGMPNEHEMMVYHTMADQAFNSKMYPNIKDKSGVMMIMLAARELGIPPCQALNGGLNLIQGKVEISARMMSALIRKAGHKLKVQECTSTQCVLVGKRCDTGETQSSSFSVAEAQLAGLIKPGGGWVKWPKDMCFARALSRLARQLFSDVIGMGYVEGEIVPSDKVKPGGYDSVFEEDMVDCEVVVENEQEYVDQLTNLFDNEDRHLVMQYVKVVQEHFDWTTIHTIKELLKDQDKLFEKFNVWKAKIKRTEEV